MTDERHRDGWPPRRDPSQPEWPEQDLESRPPHPDPDRWSSEPPWPPEPAVDDGWRPAEPWRTEEQAEPEWQAPEPAPVDDWRPAEPWRTEEEATPEWRPPEPPAPAPIREPTPAPEPPPVPEPTAPDAADEPAPPAAEVAWDRRVMGERRRPTTAEQAVPWLIGIILALAGIVLVLMALIFTSENRGAALLPPVASGSGAPLASGSATPAATVLPSSTPTESVAASATPSPSPVPAYGALEMLYLSRETATAPVFLFRRDFSVEQEAVTLARADQGISQFAWSHDGRRGAAIIAGRAVALVENTAARPLADGVSDIAFGNDPMTLYAVRVTRDGSNDEAAVLAVDWESGDEELLGSVTYPHPDEPAKPALSEAQFIDDGGLIRLYPLDEAVILWVAGAPATYRIGLDGGDVEETEGLPALESPDGAFAVLLAHTRNTATLTLVDADGSERATTSIPGLVSHIRWAPNGSEVAFTLGRTGANGGVVQNLYVWDLVDGKEPMPITSNGASFGAEWRGAAVRWVHEPQP